MHLPASRPATDAGAAVSHAAGSGGGGGGGSGSGGGGGSSSGSGSGGSGGPPAGTAAAVAAASAAPAPADADADAAALAALANATTVEHVVSLEGKAVAAGASPSISPSVWNVSAWAWEAREFTPWARARLNELLAGVDVDVPSGHVKIVEVDSVSGDASVNLRKVRARPQPRLARPRRLRLAAHLCHGPRRLPRP